jgi:thiol-disulfide isomerase/thioredoxin
VTLSQVPGKIKILDFWASWCGPCRLNNPALKKLYEEFHPKGLEVISVSLDNKKPRWEDAVAKDGLNWINVSSLKGWKCDVARLYNVTAIPAIFVLDAENRIIASNLRDEELKAFLEERLK